MTAGSSAFPTPSMPSCVPCGWPAPTAGAPASALATTTGGVSAGGTSAGSTSGSTTAGGAAPTAKAPAKKPYTAPVTSNSASIAYNGPVYEKTATGQIVPYVSAQASG